MVYKCCAQGCRGNYKNTPKVHTFGFPKDENLRALWLNFIKREKTFKVTEHTLCENHFRPEDIVKHNKVFDHQKKVYVKYELKNPYLKEKTMPHFLPGCPKCLSKPECSRKSREDKLKNKEDDELERCIAESLQTHQQYETEKSFSNLGELHKGLKKDGDLNNWTIVYYENEIVFVIFSHALISDKNEDKFLKFCHHRQLMTHLVYNFLKSEISFENENCPNEAHTENLLEFLIRSAKNALLDKYVKKWNDELAAEKNMNLRKRKLESLTQN